MRGEPVTVRGMDSAEYGCLRSAMRSRYRGRRTAREMNELSLTDRTTAAMIPYFLESRPTTFPLLTFAARKI